MEILKELGINKINYGASINNWWSSNESSGIIGIDKLELRMQGGGY